MMVKGHILILLSTVFLVACGGGEKPIDPEPVAPDQNLVGSWALERTNMVDVMAQGLVDNLRVEGYDPDTIDEMIIDFRAEMGEGVSVVRSALRFNPDGSWVDDMEGSGTWSVDGNTLIMVEEGKEERFRYFVDGYYLTIIFSSELLLDALRADEDFSHKDIALFSEILNVEGDTQIRFFYKRK